MYDFGFDLVFALQFHYWLVTKNDLLRPEYGLLVATCLYILYQYKYKYEMSSDLNFFLFYKRLIKRLNTLCDTRVLSKIHFKFSYCSPMLHMNFSSI